MRENGNACLGTGCNKAHKCAKYVGNKPAGTYYVENYASFGSGTLYSDGHIEEYYWCGERGNYAMFEELENNIEEQLKKFAERLKSKDCSVPMHEDFILIEKHTIDETLKEFVDENGKV